MSRISEGGRNYSLLSRPGVQETLDELFDSLGITYEGREFVLQAFRKPSRRVGDRPGRGGNNVLVFYISWKMGSVIQCESRTVEHAFVELNEFDPEVVYYLHQPGQLYVTRRNAKGREVGNWCTPDYLVVRQGEICLVECKPVSKLRSDAASANPRFVRDDAAGWRWPAAEEAAAKMGLGFRVFSSEEVNPTWHRNMRFLADFFQTDCPDPKLAQDLRKEISEAHSMRIPEVLDLLDMKSEVLWWAVAHREVWADLEFELLRDGDMCSVHSSKSRMIASRERQGPVSDAAISLRLNRVELEPGSRLSMNEKPYVVVVRSADQVWLREDREGSRKFAISLEDVKEFLSTGVITGVQSKDVDDICRKRSELLARASDKELAKAVTRLRWLEEYRETGKKPAGISLRSLRRYEADFRKGEQVYGSGFFGLIGERGRRPGKSDLGEKQREVLKKFVDKFAGDTSEGHLRNAYAQMKAECEKRGISPIPCMETLRQELKKRRKVDVARGRRGEREATQVSGPLITGDPVIPRKADRVWQVAHVDHLLVKVELVSFHDGSPLGKAWLTLMIDDFSRMPLGMYLSFDEPSRVPVFRVLFDCVRRHNRLPEYVVTDQGPEFHSRDVEAAFAGLEVNRVERPGGKPRFGSVIERMFGSANTRLVHELPGNVKRSQLGRARSRSHDPKRNATLSLLRLNEILEEWLFDIYPGLVHESLGQTTPRQVYGTSLAYSGERKARYIAVDMGLRMALSLTPERPTREVGEGGVIRVEGLRYHSEALLAGNVVGSKVQVKLCAEDCSVVYVWVGRKWVTCRLSDGNAEWAGRSRKERKLSIEAVRQKYRLGRKAFNLNAATIGRHLEGLDVGGKAARQAERDEEARTISGNGFSEGDGFPLGEQDLEVTPAMSGDVSADKVPEGLDPDDVLASAKPLKVVRR